MRYWGVTMTEPQDLDALCRPWFRDAFARYAPDLPVVWSFHCSTLPNPAKRSGNDGAPSLISLPTLNATVPMTQDPTYHASETSLLRPGFTAGDADEAVAAIVVALREHRGDPISGPTVVDLPSPRSAG
jgi:hypothetical protein